MMNLSLFTLMLLDVCRAVANHKWKHHIIQSFRNITAGHYNITLLRLKVNTLSAVGRPLCLSITSFLFLPRGGMLRKVIYFRVWIRGTRKAVSSIAIAEVSVLPLNRLCFARIGRVSCSLSLSHFTSCSSLFSSSSSAYQIGYAYLVNLSAVLPLSEVTNTSINHKKIRTAMRRFLRDSLPEMQVYSFTPPVPSSRARRCQWARTSQVSEGQGYAKFCHTTSQQTLWCLPCLHRRLVQEIRQRLLVKVHQVAKLSWKGKLSFLPDHSTKLLKETFAD